MVNNLTTSEKLMEEIKKHYIEMTSVGGDDEEHRAPVCVVCDRFIIQDDNKTWIKKERLLEHTERLGRFEFEVHNMILLPESLKKQYMVEDDALKHLLLSPMQSCCFPSLLKIPGPLNHHP